MSSPLPEPFCEGVAFAGLGLGLTISHSAPQLAVGSSTFFGGVPLRVSFLGGRSGTGRGGMGGGTAGVVVPLVLYMEVG